MESPAFLAGSRAKQLDTWAGSSPALGANFSRLALLSRASRAFAEAGLDQELALQSICTVVAEGLRDCCVVRLLSADRTTLLPAAYLHADPQKHAILAAMAGIPLASTEGYNGLAVTTGLLQHVRWDADSDHRVSSSPRLVRYVSEIGITSLLCAPLRSRDRTIGTVTALRDRGSEPFDEEDALFIGEIADRAALMLENCRLYQEAAGWAERSQEALAFLDIALEGAPVGFALLDHQMRYVRVNSRLASLNALPAADHLGKSVLEVLPHMAHIIEPMLTQVLRTEQPVLNVEVSGNQRGSSGPPRHCLASYYPVRIHAHQPLGVGIFVVDVTQQKEHELAALRSESWMRLLTDSVPALVSYVDRDFRYRFCNKRYREWFTVDDSELEGAKMSDVLGQAMFQRLYPHLQLAMNGSEESFEIELPHKSGGSRFARASYVPDRDASGRVNGLFILVFDLTEQQKMQATVEHWRGRVRLVEDSAQIGFWDMDLETGFLRRSPGVRRMLGYSDEDLPDGDPRGDLVHPDDLPRLTGEIRTSLDGGGDDFRCEFRAQTALKTFRWILCHGIVLRDGRNEPKSLTGMFVDITDRKQMEEALREHTEELSRSNAELARFAFVASHDLKEPLRVVSNYTQLLRKRYGGRLDESADRFISTVTASVERMYDLIHDLLEFSRLGVESPIEEDLPLAEIVQGVLDSLSVTAREAGATILTGDFPRLRGDRGQLARLFQNLIGNALKYRGEVDPVVRVSAEDLGEEWLFRIADNGIGIDPQHFDKLFVMFQRLHGAKYSGTGIGLAICKKIVERYGGRIWVESEVARGATFLFTLPKSEAPKSEIGRRAGW